MDDYLINFKDINWHTETLGFEQKTYSDARYRMRLVRFSDSFTDREWCHKDHIGFVLKGEMKLDFDGEIVHYKSGCGFWIQEGKKSKHKVIIEKGKSVELILFERK